MSYFPAIFLALASLHVVQSLVGNALRGRHDEEDPGAVRLCIPVLPFVSVLFFAQDRTSRRRAGRATVWLQSLLFGLALYYALLGGAISREIVSPVHIGLGLLLGHLVFGVSLLITHRSIRDAQVHFLDFGSVWEFMVENPRILSHFIIVACGEEVIYRVTLQPMAIAATGSTLAGILIVAVVFSLVHEHFFRNGIHQSGEFVAFAVLLGGLYYWTGSLILVIVVHALRNIEIAFLEHVITIEETGSEAEAQRKHEYLTGERALVMLTAPCCALYTLWLENGPEPRVPWKVLSLADGPLPERADGPLEA